MAAGMSSDADAARLTDGLGTRWTLAETSFKFHASCRHTHPAADALMKAMHDNGLTMDDIDSVTALVHQGAIDVLGPVVSPASVHQAKFSMGTTLGLIAAFGRAGMDEFDARPTRVPTSPPSATACACSSTRRWTPPIRRAGSARFGVATTDGRTVEARVDEPKGDPGNTLSRAEIETKVRGLASFGGGAADAEMDDMLPRLWKIEQADALGTADRGRSAEQGARLEHAPSGTMNATEPAET